MFRSVAMLIVGAVLLAGCNDDDNSSGPPQTTAPSSLSYESPSVGTVGAAFAALDPSVTGEVTSYSVSPALPPGLSIDAVTGVISGTPTAVAATATYTITASNAGGSTTYGLTLTVNPAAPSALSYAGPLNATMGAAITPLAPTVTGEVTAYSVDPALPPGLSLDSSTGVIAGTPTVVSAQATYTVTAQNVTGSTIYALVVTIAAEPGVQLAQGVFYDSVVRGLGFASGSQVGVTGSEGRFTYEIVDGVAKNVVFTVGAVTLGEVAQGKAQVTPSDLAPMLPLNSPEVLNRVRFLVMLDRDGDPANGIEVSEEVRNAASVWPQVDFSTADLPAQLATIITSAQAADGGAHVLPTAAAAEEHYRTSFLCAHSGVFVGTYTNDGADSGRLANVVYPDGTVHLLGYSDAPPAGFRFDVDGEGVITVTPEANFSFENEGMAVAGRYVGWDEMHGTWGTLNGTESGDFNATRFPDGPRHQYIGSAMTGSKDAHLGVVALNVTAGNELTGVLYLLDDDQTHAIVGTVTGSVVTGTVGGFAFTGTYQEGSAFPFATGTIANIDGAVSLNGRAVTFGTEFWGRCR